MKNNTLKTKILSLLIAFAIAVILSSIISTLLHLIFTRVPEEIINIRPNTIIQSLSSSKEHFEMFILTIVAFMLLAFLTIFKVFDLKDYKSKTYKVTNTIEIPLPIGEKQTQQGSAWWLSKKDFSKKFGVNRVDLSKKEFAQLIEIANEDKDCIKENTENLNKTKLEPIFKTGGLVIGKKDKFIPKIRCKNLGKLIRIPYLTIKKVEDIYYIDDDLHSLTVGATRSGKTRSLVLQTIANTGLAGENMILSDPKGELFEYTSKTLERLGYKVYTLDFKTPLKSSKYHLTEKPLQIVTSFTKDCLLVVSEKVIESIKAMT